MPPFRLVPISLRAANLYVAKHHRHNKPVRGWKFGVGLCCGDHLVGVGLAGRPVARALDDGVTIEVTRTCTNGEPNANSAIYGALWRAARSLGYTRCITYTQAEESGASVRAAGFRRDADLPGRRNWANSTKQQIAGKRDHGLAEYVARVRWVITTKDFRHEQ